METSTPGFQEFNLFVARLCTALRAGRGPCAAEEILEEVTVYAGVRFAEERVRAAHQGGAALAACEDAHRRFMLGLLPIRRSFAAPSADPGRVAALLHFLQVWVCGVPCFRRGDAVSEYLSTSFPAGQGRAA
ncbi:MAG: hypothetical protein P1P84_00940 [Deferrisomatales bacterium]|nr:hypothetical protein [Deferrisomatales bacterium]